MKYASRCITRSQIINDTVFYCYDLLFLIKLSDNLSVHVVDFIDEIIFSVLLIYVITLFLLIVVILIFLHNSFACCMLMGTEFSGYGRYGCCQL